MSPAALSRLRTALAAIALGLALAGCQSELTTGSISKQAATTDVEKAMLKRAAELQKKYKRNPQDAEIALAFSDALATIGRPDQGFAVLKTASAATGDGRLLSAYGRATLRKGNAAEALSALERAAAAGARDPKSLSAQAAALDQLGRNAEAQALYHEALAIAPDDPAILSNLGLSYALSNRIKDAEATLRRAAASPGADIRVRQNLVLVLGLQGKFDEAEAIARQDLPAADAAANIAYLKQMMTSPDRWKKLTKLDGMPG